MYNYLGLAKPTGNISHPSDRTHHTLYQRTQFQFPQEISSVSVDLAISYIPYNLQSFFQVPFVQSVSAVSTYTQFSNISHMTPSSFNFVLEQEIKIDK